MATSYPGGYDSLPRPTASDTMNDTAGGLDGPAVIDNISDAIEAIEAELGTDPAGAYATVAARLTAIAASASSALAGFYDVTDSAYGAVGDDTNDDTAEIQAALTAGAGAIVYFPEGTYKITSALTVSAGTTITGTGTIHQATTGAVGLDVGGSNVTIEGIALKGPQAGLLTYDAGETAIDVTAANLAGSFVDVTIRGVTMYDWGQYGVKLHYVAGFDIAGCNIYDIGYAGVMLLSCSRGTVTSNRIDNITPGTSSNMYGIAMSYSGTASASEPSTSDVVVDGNLVSNSYWEGIDSHGGSRLTITNNTVTACGTGITVFGLAALSTHTPTDVVIANNVVDTLQDTVWADTNASAILLQGYNSTNLASGSIVGNTVRRSNATTIKFTRAVVIANNVFVESNPVGIQLSQYNYNFSITGNSFIDIWSDTANSRCVNSAGQFNSGLVAGNVASRANKSATYALQYGFDNADTNCTFRLGVNDFSACTVAPVDDVTGVTAARFEQGLYVKTDVEIDGALNHDGSTVGFYGTTPTAKQTGVPVTAAGVHAALVALGLISA